MNRRVWIIAGALVALTLGMFGSSEAQARCCGRRAGRYGGVCGSNWGYSGTGYMGGGCGNTCGSYNGCGWRGGYGGCGTGACGTGACGTGACGTSAYYAPSYGQTYGAVYNSAAAYNGRYAAVNGW